MGTSGDERRWIGYFLPKDMAINTAALKEAYAPAEETGKETGRCPVSVWREKCNKLGKRGVPWETREGPAHSLGR